MTVSGVQRWWWVRHAPVVGFHGELNGRLDVEADCSDAAAFQILAESLPRALALVTPLQRTRQTFEAVRSAGLALAEPEVEPDFMEQAFGEWQGLTWTEIQARDPAAEAVFWQDPCRNRPPGGGESFADQMARVAAAVERRLADAQADRIVFAHGGTIRAAVGHAMGLTPEQAMAVAVDNLSLTRLDFIPGGTLNGKGGVWRVQYVNRAPRLDSPPRA